jgi:hypothetical protein
VICSGGGIVVLDEGISFVEETLLVDGEDKMGIVWPIANFDIVFSIPFLGLGATGGGPFEGNGGGRVRKLSE